jgi:Ca2+-binding RTX toxin-like protein
VTVTLNDVADDGDPTANAGAGEKDNVKTSIERLIGGAGDDFLIGDQYRNWICGLDGNDDIDGLAGDDDLDGNAADDELFGGDGNDLLGHVRDASVMPEGASCPDPAGAGDDPGTDTMHGQNGNDTFNAKDGTVDTLNGDAGTDGGVYDANDIRTSIP